MAKPRLTWRILPLLMAGFVLTVLALSVRTPSGRPAFGHIGEPMPGLEFQTLDGQPWHLSDYRGKPVLLNFWATWCSPCRMETPGLVRLAAQYRSKGLVVAGVSMDDGGLEAVRQFVHDFRVPYSVLLPNQDSPLLSEISSLPTTIFIDRQGRVAKTYYGAMPEKLFRAEADRLLERN